MHSEERHNYHLAGKAYELLENDDIVTTAIPPVLPKADEVYFFKPDE